MVPNSDILEQHESFTTTFPTEIMGWYLYNDTDTIIIIWNDLGEIIYGSRLIEEYFSYKMDDLIGKQWTFLLPDEVADHIKQHFKEGEQKLHIPNIKISTKKGMTHAFNGIIDKIKIKEELFSICKLRNITYLNELKQVLLDSEKLVLAGQLSAGLVHEIRNPLTSLKGFLQLVQAGVKQREEYYRVMIGEIDKLEKFTSELLNLAKPFESSKKTEYIYQMIEDVLFLLKTQTDLRNVHFEVDLQDDLVTNCSASQIKQALINIIKNGTEAMEKNGTIHVRTRREGKYVAIDVTDEGKGIPDEIVQELNNPFFTTKTEGTGLGLVITHHILEQHNGKLHIDSTQGKGTTFTILLPTANDK